MADVPHAGVVVPYAAFLERRKRRERIATELKRPDRAADAAAPDPTGQPDPVDPNSATRVTEIR
jgi:hypothetical protein